MLNVPGRITILVAVISLLMACAPPPPKPIADGAPPDTPATSTVLPTLTSVPLPLPTETAQLAIQTATSTLAPAAPPEKPELRYLEHRLREAVSDFEGLQSIYVVDLATGETLNMNGDLAIAGMSLVKIPILVETYRVLDQPPDVEQTKLISETMGILSGNATANWLLEIIGGRGDPFVGADSLNMSMKELGLFDTFISVPYDLEARPDRLPTFLTPANQRTDQTTFPDPYRQTTVRDLGRLLTMVYACAQQGEGPLIDAFPGQVTREECQEMLIVMQRLELDAFIEEGVPEGVPIAHKHGWIDDTHGDAGIVFSSGGDYVLAIALYAPDWLEWDTAAPRIAEISRLTYTHFNEPRAYGDLVLPPEEVSPTTVGTATPDLPRAFVSNTSGIGLTVRASPGGEEVAIVADGTVLAILDEPPVQSGNYEWFHVLLPNGQSGWAAGDFFTLWDEE